MLHNLCTLHEFCLFALRVRWEIICSKRSQYEFLLHPRGFPSSYCDMKESAYKQSSLWFWNEYLRTENFSNEFALIISAKAQPRLYNESYHVYWAVGFTQLHFEYPFCYPQLPPPQWHFHDAKIRNLINFRRLLTFKVFNLFRKYSRVKARGSKDYRQK